MENERELLKNALQEFIKRLEGYGIKVPKQGRDIREILDRFAPLQWCIYCYLQKRDCRCKFPYYVVKSKLGENYIITCARCGGVNEKEHTCGEEGALILQEVHIPEQVQA